MDRKRYREDELEIQNGFKRFRIDENANYSTVLSFRERFFPVKNNFAQYFPNNILFKIFEHFSQPEVIRISHVCRHWYSCSRDNITWRNLNLKGFNVKTLPDVMQLIHSIFRMIISPYQKTRIIPIQQLKSPIKHLIFKPNVPCTFITPDNLIRLTSIAPFVESLTLPSVNITTNSVNDHMIEILATRLPKLRKLNISTHSLVTNRGLQFIAKNCSSLTHLKFDYCHQITSEGLMMLLKECPKLQSISCLYCRHCILSTANIVPFSEICSKLLHMEIDVHPELENLEKFFLRSCNFRSLHLRGWYIRYAFRFVNAIKYLKRLKSLKVQFHPKTLLQKCRIENPCVRTIHLSRARMIRQVEVFNCTQLEDVVLQKIGTLDRIRFQGCPNIKFLKFQGSRIGVPCFDKYIDNFPKLEVFELFDCSGVECFKTESKAVKDLRILMCRDMKHISIMKATNLLNLRLDLCMNLNSLICVAPRMKQATLFQTPHEEIPNMNECQIYSEQLNGLSFPRCVHLRKLKLECINLQSLNLSDCKSLTLRNMNLNAPQLVKFGLSLPSQSQDFNSSYITNVLFPRHRNLRMISLSNMVGIQDQTLELLCRMYMNTLQAVSLSNISGLVKPRIGGNQIVGVEISNCPSLIQPMFRSQKLRKLFFRNCDNLSDATLDFLSAQNVPSLLALECRFCPKLRNPKIVLPNLKALVFDKCAFLNQPFIQCPNLKETLFQDCYSLTSPFYSSEVEQISKLVFSNCEHANDTILKTVNNKSPFLESLYLHQCNKVMNPVISRLPRLNYITFSACRNLVSPIIQNCVSLQELRFKLCPQLGMERIEDSISVSSGKLRLLEILGAQKLFNFSAGVGNNNEGMLQMKNVEAPLAIGKLMIGKCNNLNFLNLTMPNSSDFRVFDCPNLCKVQASIGSGNQNNNGSFVLERLRKLNVLQIRGIANAMIHSCLSLDDEGVANFLKGDVQFGNSNLANVNIVKCDRILKPLISHPKIRYLRIYDCKNMQQFKGNLPSLEGLFLRGNGFSQHFSRNVPQFLEKTTKDNVREVVLNGRKIK